MSADASAAKFAALEKALQRSPRAYRMRLAAMALFGRAVLWFLSSVPFLLPILSGAAFYVFAFASANWAVVLFFSLGLLLFIPARRSAVDGMAITADDAPDLFKDIERMRQALDAPVKLDVRLNDDFNASALEEKRLFGLLSPRFVLTLGIRLVASIKREELLAVIAHELGHFSRRHGRLGHWLYRTHVTWSRFLADYAGSDVVLDRAARNFAQLYFPAFDARCLVLGRSAEYEADRDSASVAGARPAADALIRTALMGRDWQRLLRLQFRRMARDAAAPIEDVLAFTERMVAEAPEAERRKWLDGALAEPSSWDDTHPSLSDRLGALGQTARIPDLVREADSAAMLFKTWPAVRAGYNARWQDKMRASWLDEHRHWHLAVAPELDVDPLPPSATLEARIYRAEVRRAVDPDLVVPALVAIADTLPDDPRATFALAHARLMAGESEAVRGIETVAAQEPALRMNGYGSLVRHFAAHPSDAVPRKQLAAWSRESDDFYRMCGGAIDKAGDDAKYGEAVPSRMPDSWLAYLSTTIADDPRVASAWLLERAIVLKNASLPVRVVTLVLAIDPREVEKTDGAAPDVFDQHASRLADLPPWTVPAVRMWYTTEIIPEALRRLKPLFSRYP